jgi:electron transfer flavoprotein beta subunit
VKIVVAVKQVASLDDEFELLDDRSVDSDFIEWELNEWDTFSLEAALQMAEAAGDSEVVAVSVGDAEADDGLRACLAMGADRAVRVWDETLEGADALAAARVLAAVVEREAPDLVLCGVQSSDAINGATGVALAAYLGLAHVAVVKALEGGDGALTVHRELEGGLIEVVRVALPALLTIQTGINKPRYATLRAIKQARSKPLDVLDLADIALDEGTPRAAAGARVRRLAHHEQGRRATMLAGSPQDVAARIAEIVKERIVG